MQDLSVSWRSRIVSGTAAIALAAGLAVSAAAAPQEALAAASAEGYVTCASYRAAEPAPEILGLSNIGTNSAWGKGLGELDWSSPYYYLIGTDLNSNPNPYVVNAVSNYQAGAETEKPTLTYYERSGGPMAAMFEYGSDKAGSDAVWEMLPDVILGTGNDTSAADVYDGENYAPAVAAALGVEYDPIGVTYNRTNNYTMIDVMYNLAAAADQVVAENDGTKFLRYGEAMPIAREYEEYVIGTYGYVLANTDAKKTVACVGGYDAASGTYTLIQTGVAEGTASANRFLEAVQPVAINLGDTKTTVTQDELAGVDLILLGSQTGREVITSPDDILASFTEEMRQKTFWGKTDAGAMYGVIMNSVENAQNVGRILGCLYPEIVDQDDWVSYYYDHFYHLATGQLGYAIDNAMDGVRNWDASGSELTSWTADDASTYDSAAVKSKLQAGMAYVYANQGKVPAYLKVDSRYGIISNFNDVKAGQWYAGWAYYVAQRGLMTGVGDKTSFGVGRKMTRADFVTVLYRYANPDSDATTNEASFANDTTGFADNMSGQYYTAAVNWAKEVGITNGYTSGPKAGTFGVADPLKFQDMMTMIQRFVAPDAAPDVAALDSFTDGSTIADYARTPIAWAVENGIVNGNTNADGSRTIAPKSDVLRERTATVFGRALANDLL